jgi:heme-degrading monooxygenase HmoA
MTPINKSKLPYYSVIFTSTLTKTNDGYSEMANRMVELAKEQPGFIGVDSARNEIGITVSYWESLEAIKAWKNISEHKIAQTLGKEKWYKSFTLRICKVEHEYDFSL